MITISRALFALACAVLLMPLAAGSAAAHSGGLESEPFLPRVLALEPPVPGLDVAVVEGGARIALLNGTGEPVDVLPPAGAPRTDEPVVAPGERVHWADVRITAASTAGPGPAAWTVPLRVGATPVTVRGETVWPPPPSTAGWWGLTAALAALTALLGGLAVRRRAASAAIAGLTVTMIAAHVVHVLGSALVPIDLPYWPTVAGTAGIGLAAWAVGLAGAGLATAGLRWGLLLCAVAGAVLALVTALDTGSFAEAVLPYGWAPTLDRASTAVTVGAGFGLFLTGFAVLRAMTPALPHDDPARPAVPEKLP